MPPRYPNIGHLEPGRTSRLYIPPTVCPEWFRNGVKVWFVPLHWINDIFVSDSKILEAFLICSVDEPSNPSDWKMSPVEVLANITDQAKVETLREASLIYKSELEYHNREWRLNCPPLIKGLVDIQRRLYTTEHSLGVCIWSPAAFNEHYGKI